MNSRMMTPEQRYLFDMTGYLHIEGAVTGENLKDVQEAANQYIYCHPNDRSPGFGPRGEELSVEELGNRPLIRYQHGFAFDRCLEALTTHPAIWPILKELTANMPRLVSGTLSYEQHNPDRQQVEKNPAGLHCAREGRYWYTRYQVKDGYIFCNDLVFFFYLTDVNPGDGGLIVIPGSHKSEFERPDELLKPGPDGIDPAPDTVFTNLTPKAGDFLCISELLTHGVLQWKPKDRSRQFLILRYRPQYEGKVSLPQVIIDRLTPETQELVASASYGRIKEIAEHDVVTLSA
ncbi:hypothetical protein CMK14_10825 [Candidatus Poribacteria bacterium]|nr:hypothetical protein [Candidatus Poribacteria bacterium]